MLKKLEEELLKQQQQHVFTVRVVVVGAGAAGVEILASVRERFKTTFSKFSKKLLLHYTLVDSHANFGESLRIEDLGASIGATLQNTFSVKTIFNARALKVTDNELHLSNGSIVPFHCLFWACGASAPSVFKNSSGLTCDASGYLVVNEFLQCPNYKNILAAGDCITMKKYPSVAKAGVYAVRAGPILSQNIQAIVTASLAKKEAVKLVEFVPQSTFLKVRCCNVLFFNYYYSVIEHGGWHCS